MKKIVVIGSTGSGKSIFARKLAQKSAVDFIELDDEWWLPLWQTRTVEAFRARVAARTGAEAWVVAGNYSKINDVTRDRADTLIWLDYPFSVVFWRLLKRSLSRALLGAEVCNGNKETFRKLLFSRESILLWLIQSYAKKKKEYGAVFTNSAQHPHITLLRFTHPRQAEEWLETIR